MSSIMKVCYIEGYQNEYSSIDTKGEVLFESIRYIEVLLFLLLLVNRRHYVLYSKNVSSLC